MVSFEAPSGNLRRLVKGIIANSCRRKRKIAIINYNVNAKFYKENDEKTQIILV